MNLRPSVSGSCGRVYCTLVLRREGTMDGREEGLVVESAECAGLKLPVFSVSSAAPRRPPFPLVPPCCGPLPPSPSFTHRKQDKSQAKRDQANRGPRPGARNHEQQNRAARSSGRSISPTDSPRHLVRHSHCGRADDGAKVAPSCKTRASLATLHAHSMDTFQNLVSTAEERLSSTRFCVSRSVALPDGSTADLAASRTAFSWKCFVVLSQHLLLRSLSTCSISELQTFFETGFRYGKHVNRVPLLRGLRFGYMIIPCVAVESATPELIAYATSCPRKHWSLFEFPVVHDLSSGQTYFYRETGAWGALFFSDMRSIVESSIATSQATLRG